MASFTQPTLFDAERILESIPDAFFALDTDWRFTYLNTRAEQMLRPRAALLGRSVWEEFPAAIGTAFDRQYRRVLSDQVAVVFEEYYPPPLDTWFEVRAFPSPEGISVYFRDITQKKALEEKQERLNERERNIAQQLQAALMPTIPERVPGMAIAEHYKAALSEEAAVGGDFYDVFPLETGCTALVVGDLSGKGLAAASQVATVRNMLRYALHRARTLIGAVTSLNGLLAKHRLLSGFATLFVGTYDKETHLLTYVNCGQEPALVWRAATGDVEELPSTGPILGAFENMDFEARGVALGPSDALVLFTDGLTEVGPSRREMLGIEGVAALLSPPFSSEEPMNPSQKAESLARRLIAGVDAAAAGGVMRDDMCLLVAVVEDGAG